VLGAITVGQRMWTVYQQDQAAHPMTPPAGPAGAAGSPAPAAQR